MKHTKRILATILTLALALSLALPATAAADFSEFRITKQPQGLTIKEGESFTLSVKVNVPVGAEVEYRWYRGSYELWGELYRKPDLYCTARNSDYPAENSFYDFHCEVTAYEKDNNGVVVSTEKLTTDKARVTVEERAQTFWGKIYSVTLEPFAYAVKWTAATILTSVGIAIPLSPFYFLHFLIRGYFEGFKGLF